MVDIRNSFGLQLWGQYTSQKRHLSSWSEFTVKLDLRHHFIGLIRTHGQCTHGKTEGCPKNRNMFYSYCSKFVLYLCVYKYKGKTNNHICMLEEKQNKH